MPRQVRQLKFSGAQKQAAETSQKLGVRSGSLRSTYSPHVGEKEKRRALRKLACGHNLSEAEKRVLDVAAAVPTHSVERAS